MSKSRKERPRKPGGIKIRHAGDTVYLVPNAGFTGESNVFKLLLPTDPELNGLGPDGRPEDEFCMLSCGNPDCREWANVEIILAPAGREDTIGHHLYHVSECQMYDEPQPPDLRRWEMVDGKVVQIADAADVQHQEGGHHHD